MNTPTTYKNVYSTYAVVYSTIFMFLVGFPRYSMDTAKTHTVGIDIDTAHH